MKIVRDGDDDVGSGGGLDVAGAASAAAPETLTRADLYRSANEEKKTRARLRAVTERALNGRTIVICDSLNYIKGFRYEMYCVAKTTGTRYCVVFCDQPAEASKKWDAERGERGEDCYGAELCDALIRRFETPVERNRWDSPLHRINITDEGWEASLEAARNSVLRSSMKLVPTMATRIPEKLGADVLGLLDRLTREAETAIIEELQAGKGIGQKIQVPGGTKVLRLERKPRVAELRNMRRSYLGLARMHPPQGKGRQGLVDEYVEYLNAQLRIKR